jgi:uncharacterized membrane protein
MELLNVETVILLVVTFLVTAGIKSFSAQFGIDISGQASVITAAIVAATMGLIRAYAGQIPAEYLPVIEQIAGVLITLLGAAGLHKTMKAK